jgi:hypothetical protein
MKREFDYILLLDFFARLVESTKGTVLDGKTVFLADTQPLAAKFLLHQQETLDKKEKSSSKT